MSIHLTRIYTRGGDKGQTSLTGGERVSKAHPRLDTYGTADELNSCLGMIRTLACAEEVPEPLRQASLEQLAIIQNELFNAGSAMARSDGSADGRINPESVGRLEQWIDQLNESLPPLTSFVLPGGHPINAWAHIARTICRRLERELVSAEAQGFATEAIVHAWVNRLSDWLFVYSRFVSLHFHCTEYLWVPGQAKPI